MAHVDFSAIINDFLTAELGEDVRDSLVAIARALEEAINAQLTTVTTDVNNEDANTALRVRTLKRLFPNFGGYLKDPDLNAIKGNVFYIVNLADNSIEFTPLPDLLAKAASLLLCFGDEGVSYQIFVGLYGDVFTRRYLRSRDEWSDWNGGIDADLAKSNAAADAQVVGSALDTLRTEAVRAYGMFAPGDLNEILSNSLYAVNVSLGTYQNLPPGASGVIVLLTMQPTKANAFQVAFGSRGRLWQRRHTANGWDSWSDLDAKIDTAIATALTAFRPRVMAYNSLLEGGSIDGIYGNVITMLNVSSYSYTTLPDGASGVMVLLSYGGNNLNGSSWQVLLGSTGRLWERRYTAGSWEAWQQVDQNTKKMIVNSRVTVTSANKDSYFTNCDDAPLNTIYRVNKNAQLVNAPYGDGMSSASGVYDGTYRDIAGWDDGTLITYGTEDIYKHQIFISGKVSGASTGRVPPSNATLFFRTYYNSASPGWGDWRCVSDLRSPTASNIAIRKKFIAPWLDDQGNPTATDTGVPNPQYIADDPRFFNDFDNAPFNSIYQIDLDNDESVMAHNPRPGKSSVLVTTGFSWVGMQHGKIQFCVGIDAGTTFAYIRYGYIQSASQGIYIWTNWLHVGDAGEVDALKARVAALEAQVAALGG